MRSAIALAAALSAGAAIAEPALATQGHGGPEGLYVHQMSHVFFAFSMGILIYWLRVRGLHRQQGWRHIQYAACLFIVWTLDAFMVHLFEEQLRIAHLSPMPGLWATIDAADDSIAIKFIYYCIKLDHLFCVPALFFLYMGLRSLLKQSESGASLLP